MTHCDLLWLPLPHFTSPSACFDFLSLWTRNKNKDFLKAAFEVCPHCRQKDHGICSKASTMILSCFTFHLCPFHTQPLLPAFPGQAWVESPGMALLGHLL